MRRLIRLDELMSALSAYPRRGGGRFRVDLSGGWEATVVVFRARAVDLLALRAAMVGVAVPAGFFSVAG
jgi:hypothetical protein